MDIYTDTIQDESNEGYIPLHTKSSRPAGSSLIELQVGSLCMSGYSKRNGLGGLNVLAVKERVGNRNIKRSMYYQYG